MSKKKDRKSPKEAVRKTAKEKKVTTTTTKKKRKKSSPPKQKGAKGGLRKNLESSNQLKGQVCILFI
jgi:hypothetical protein